MKKCTFSFITILIIFILAISIMGCGQQSTQSPTPSTSNTTNISTNKTYSDSEYGFSMAYPTDWNIKGNLSDSEKNTGIVAVFEGPTSPKYNDRVQIYIKINDLGGEATAEEYAAGFEKDILKKNISNYTNIQEQKTIISGLNAVIRVFTGAISGTPLKFTQTYFTMGRIGYVITYQATIDIYDNYYDAYDLALNSFKLS